MFEMDKLGFGQRHHLTTNDKSSENGSSAGKGCDPLQRTVIPRVVCAVVGGLDRRGTDRESVDAITSVVTRGIKGKGPIVAD